ncbi:MAG: hypothetical protein COX40_00715 [Candidatus Omnitrophica bacterium CG23_combo_of_CG06-09_8_20_14_all_40_11]|nr:MAG: hypothetical protein COX40_00715 [Candidatus Omnitrophica bacterium CG23_combo_of_CG06-09_8_20_14_all_40_11]
MELLKRLGIVSTENNFRENAVYALACAYAFVEKEISDYLRPFKLTPAKFNAMMVIKHIGKDKGLSQVEIGRRLIVTASNITRLLDKLDREGYIERLSRKGDRRVNLIRISKKGSETLDQVWPGYHRRIVDIADILSKGELKQISGLLVKWCEKVERGK